MVMPCFLNRAVVWSRNRECNRSIELPSRTVYVLNSKHRDSLATFLISAGKFGPQGGVGAAGAGAAPRGPACPAGPWGAAHIHVPAIIIPTNPAKLVNESRFLM